MLKIEATELLRANLLKGASIVLAGPPAATAQMRAVRLACTELGARVADCELVPASEPAAQEEAAERAMAAALSELGEGAGALVVDGAGLFKAARGREALAWALQASWSAVRAIANAAFLPPEGGGRVLLLAPPPDAGEHAEGVRAGLENLARTLSIEWARYGVTILTIALGCETEPAEATALIAYLASPAGAYFSGCELDLRGVTSAR